MTNILQKLKDTYTENPAKALELLPELFNEVEKGYVVEISNMNVYQSVNNTMHFHGKIIDTLN